MGNPRVHPSFPNGATEEPHDAKWAPYIKGNPPVRKPEGDAYERAHEVIDGLVSAATHGHDLTVKSATLHTDGAYTDGKANVESDGAYFAYSREADDMVVPADTCRAILENNHACLQNRGAQAWAQTKAETMSVEEMLADTHKTTIVAGNVGFRSETFVNTFVYACKTLWSNLKPYVARESKTTRASLKRAFGDNDMWGRFWEWAYMQDETLQSLASSAQAWASNEKKKPQYLARMKTIIEDEVYGDAWEARNSTPAPATGTSGVIQNPNPVTNVASAPAQTEVVASPSGDVDARIASMRAAGMTGDEIANALGL